MSARAVRRGIATGLLAAAMTFGAAAPAFAGNPHAGGSGHFKGSAQPCSSSNNKHCPPFGK